MNKACKNIRGCKKGIVLVLTIVTLVVLATMLYTLGSKLFSRVHRDQYIIDYQNARYACDSATKYALAVIDEYKFDLIARPNEPDFSDLFQMSQEEYDLILEQYKQQLAVDPNLVDANSYGSEKKNKRPESDNLSFAMLIAQAEGMDIYEANPFDINDTNTPAADHNSSGMAGGFFGSLFGPEDFNDSNTLDEVYIRGPYGPKWPLVQDTLEFEIGNSTVVIEIEDENAKLPATWALISDDEYKKPAEAAVESFFEWMGLDLKDIEDLKDDMANIQEIKEFSINMKAPVITSDVSKEVTEKKEARRNRRSRRSRQKNRRSSRRKTVQEKKEREMTLHKTDFSKIFNSSQINHKLLNKPAIESVDRIESAGKYLGLWGSGQVNINTAPRHVLEAAFTFGGDEVGIAESIIQMRKIRPFGDVNELSKELYGYNDTIEKSKPYITTRSNVFTVKITAYSGTAKVSAVAAVLKQKDGVKRIALKLK